LKRRILIVDDDVWDAAALERYLRERGVEVEAAVTEPSARQRLAEEPPAILIIDACAPSIDAPLLLREYRQSNAAGRATIVAWSDRRAIPPVSLSGLVDVQLNKPWARSKGEVHTFVQRIFACFEADA
jgi:PleD family two-component response regulator